MKTSITQPSNKLYLNSVVRTSVVIFLFIAGAKVLNFVKKILISQLFGVSSVADAFFSASYLPYYLGVFFEGFFFLGFLPLFAEIVADKGKEESDKLISSLLLLTFLVTGLLALLAWQFAPWIIREVVPGFNVKEQALTVELFKILSLAVIFMGGRSFFQALNSFFDHQAFSASSGFVDSFVMLAVTLVSWRTWGIYGAAWGATAGIAVVLISQAIFFFQKHPLQIWHLGFPVRPAVKLFYFLIPMAAIWFFQQVPLVILNRFGSGMWEGTISALTISQTMTTVPIGFINQTVLMAIFPFLARQIQETSKDNVRDTFFQTLRGSFFILIPLGFLLTVLARPIAVVFFNGGGISEEGTRRIANSIACFGWATFALYADLFMTQSLIAIRKTKIALGLCITRAALSYIFSYLFSSLWDYQGVALAFSLALAANFFFLFPVFFQKSPFVGKWRSIFAYTFSLLLASSPCVLVQWYMNHRSIHEWLAAHPLWVSFEMGVACLGTAILYLMLLSLLRVQEVDSLFKSFKRKFSKKNIPVAETVS